MYNFIQEVKMILTYTNVTPFKSKANRYYCAYCASEGPMFDNPNDLRTHTRTVHINDRTSRIEFAMRPHWLNEILKIDIDNLLCNVCCIAITSWNDMFRHLRDKHNVVLDQTYTRLVPYVLTDQLKCALCKYPFTNYMHLDSHMNAHYENYICDDCGDTFISSYRLKQHSKIHAVGKFPCRYCSKVFALEKYRKKHEEMIHELLPKFKCLYCPDKFLNEYFRHLHVVDKHNEKVNIITCELCGLTFTWPAYYHCHMRKKHKKLASSPKFECEFCGNCFYNKELLEEHLETHAGESSYMCGVCGKTFPSMIKMNAHIKIHDKKKKKEEGTTNDDDTSMIIGV